MFRGEARRAHHAPAMVLLCAALVFLPSSLSYVLTPPAFLRRAASVTTMQPTCWQFGARPLSDGSAAEARAFGGRHDTWGLLSLAAAYEGVDYEQSLEESDTYELDEEDEGPRFDENDLKRLKVPDLKQLCDSYGVSKTGKKSELIERLLQAQADELGMTVAEVGVVTDMMLGEDAAEAMVRAATGRSLKPDCSRPRAMALTGALNGCGLARARSEAIGVMSQLEEGELRFVTQPRTGNCWHGIIFDVEAKDQDLIITSVNTASSPESQGPVREDKMNVQLYTCEGSSVGQHKNPDAWTRVGTGRGVQLPVVAYGEMEAFYGPLPMEAGPITIKAGTSRGFCVFASSWRGVVLRSNLGSTFAPGDATEENEHLILRAGLLPKNDRLFEDTMFTEVYHEEKANAFVGAIGYKLG